MTLILLAVAAAIVLGFAFRGSIATFLRPPTRRNGLLAFGAVSLGAALIAKHPEVAAGWLLAGAAALVAYELLNRGRPGLLLAALGMIANAVVIFANWSMPVSLDAAERAGVPESRLELADDPLRESLVDDTLLPWMGETIPLALPWRPAVASPGDLLTGAGLAVFIFTGLTGRGRPRPAAPTKSRKGKRARRRKRREAAAAAADATTQSAAVATPVTAASVFDAPRAASDGLPPEAVLTSVRDTEPAPLVRAHAQAEEPAADTAHVLEPAVDTAHVLEPAADTADVIEPAPEPATHTADVPGPPPEPEARSGVSPEVAAPFGPRGTVAVPGDEPRAASAGATAPESLTSDSDLQEGVPAARDHDEPAGSEAAADATSAEARAAEERRVTARLGRSAKKAAPAHRAAGPTPRRVAGRPSGAHAAGSRTARPVAPASNGAPEGQRRRLNPEVPAPDPTEQTSEGPPAAWRI